ncbi:stevor PIR protein, putative [Plasmodium sp. gorilla clade G2]|uniref:stevor PIR protein, putative n=1 Tax=Plasmodium sp. gorilla clade G2 TaxID=880535 RepID=UPI000D205112|nr:stevor PIR protein, putative [Plasmodium sp. gorilla clade G2]SOV12743.1 stevor PIR protein, putative [Plasmodium sp. gorilla clade G2]
MNMGHLKMLLFFFIFNTFLLLQNVNYRNNHYNISHIPYNTQRTTTKSRVLAEIERSNNPHYHNDPELKEIIDKLNEEAIKKYQQTYDPYEQLQDVVEKKGTKIRSTYGAEPMSTLEKELLEIYEEMFGDQNSIMLKSGINCNQNDKSCEFTNKENSSTNSFLSNTVHNKYLDNLRTGCIGSVNTCALSSIITGSYGVTAGVTAAKAAIASYYVSTSSAKLTEFLVGIKVFFDSLVTSALGSIGSTGPVANTALSGITSASTGAFFPYGMAIVSLIAVTIIVILLYILLRKRRKNTWKHDCKKHLCT